MRDPSNARFPSTVGLIIIAAIGAFFIALGVHARNMNLYPDRPMKPYWNIGIGSIFVAFVGIELILRGLRGLTDRIGSKRR